ncbi:phosphate ABC transporter substrate-binding protein [Pseudohalocynthiibacter aestuariivivens]|uniref:Substrate-binding domain-containing protein n=1 Tax=Roseovarius pelagicus TaxID=2980108 RepID=A0ABY6DF45_9RHOB|nr:MULTISPECIES: substrate-binding domain-containing protein [Rhodobacterales]QIE44505.1 phosphate ABC transporter substrate-binding protein [Pseudohalocynthiibacter aestuariivivens]UXX83593.1 substrate-binding domain-containing protein [Roseovarius pelagicus]
MSFGKVSTSVLALVAVSATAAAARDEIRIVGSSTVFPYTQAVAEQFSNVTGAPSPIVESTGTGGGMKIFCGGIGEGHPDITGASRAMKASEYALCIENGVTEVTEVQIGNDGLSIAVSRESAHDWDLTEEQVYLALAAEVPVDGAMVANPYMKWSDIDASLPNEDILAYGPPPTSGTRDAFVELAIVDGCMDIPMIKEKGHDWAEDNCARLRQDGPFVEAGENDNLIVQRLQADANAVGIFGYSFLYENSDTLKAVSIEGVEPSFDTIESGDYDISRPLFFYVKNAHRGVIPNLQEFIEEYVSEDAMGPGGYLSERGLVPLGDATRTKMQDNAVEAMNMEAKS